MQGMTANGTPAEFGAASVTSVPPDHLHGGDVAQHETPHADQDCHTPGFAGDHCAACAHYCALQDEGLAKLPGKARDSYHAFSVAVITVSLSHEIRPPIA
jgi:hypothetical protein